MTCKKKNQSTISFTSITFLMLQFFSCKQPPPRVSSWHWGRDLHRTFRVLLLLSTSSAQHRAATYKPRVKIHEWWKGNNDSEGFSVPIIEIDKTQQDQLLPDRDEKNHIKRHVNLKKVITRQHTKLSSFYLRWKRHNKERIWCTLSKAS